MNPVTRRAVVAGEGWGQSEPLWWRFDYDGRIQPYTRTLAGKLRRQDIAYHAQQNALGLLMKSAWRRDPIPKGYGLSITLRFWVKSLFVGDLDNLAKAVLDAGNGVVWTDDRYVINLQAQKVRSQYDDQRANGFSLLLNWRAEAALS